ncbi:MAG: outer membrane protein transport protein [Spongiibacteraceae bacterium]
MNVKTLTHSSLFILSAALSTTAFGSGFALNELSARSTAQAFAGRVSDADEAATVATNPAGMSLLKHAEVSFGASFVDAKSDISNVSSKVSVLNVSGTNDGDMIPFTSIPFGYYVQPIDDKLALGFGVYAPFGLATEHEDTFQGRYFGTVSDIQVITFQPTVSYKLTNNLSLGLGITYNRFDGKLEKAIFTGASSPDARAKVKGDDDAWGYNLGAIYEFSADTRIGLTYYSKVKYTLDGHTTLSSVPVPLGGPSLRYNASLDIETPDRIDLGITHNLTPDLTLHGEIVRTNWKTLDEIRVENETSNPVFATSVEPLDWDKTMLYSIALSYKLAPQWILRGGFALDEQPMSDSTRSVRLPAGDRKIYSLGTTWSPMQSLDIDLAYMYIKEDSATVSQRTSTLSGGLPITYSAKFENEINIFALQGTWKF